MENNDILKSSREDYREQVNTLGKKEFTLMKMQEYGFWPKDLPTPYEVQENETEEEFNKRKALLKEYEKITNDILKLYKNKEEINRELGKLRKKYNQIWDYERIRKDVAQHIMKESIARRKARKEQKENERIKKSEQWKKIKSENIVYIGKGYSGLLYDKEYNEDKLNSLSLPIIKDDKQLAEFLEIEYKQLRFLAYHRDVVISDHYSRFTVPKRKGGVRNIAAPKSIMKKVQRTILEKMLYKIDISENVHGFIKGKSVVTGAKVHNNEPDLLINMDIENFFPTLTFERVRKMFLDFGYSGYISSILAMLCTYCERMPIEIKGKTRYVKTSERILPQGSPASPMITNIICRNLDKRLNGLSKKYNFIYTRYADDMSFSFKEDLEEKNYGVILNLVTRILNEEGFKVNKNKTKFLRKNNRQCITGIVVNNPEIGISKKWIKNLRAAIYNANKLKQSNNLPHEKIYQISGMVSWVKSVNEKKYQNIIKSYEELIKN